MGLGGGKWGRGSVGGLADSLPGHRFEGNQTAQLCVPRVFLLDSHPPTPSRRLAPASSLGDAVGGGAVGQVEVTKPMVEPC